MLIVQNYTQPEEVAYAYEELSKISPRFTIAAAFGNVHGYTRKCKIDTENFEKLSRFCSK
jgi:fructose/tagatose bisphosphate aldolase